jgi:adenylate kinase family enzyme
MRRVLVIGAAGAGKSTFSRALAAITGLPLIHLDAEFWQAGWRETPRELWKQRVAELLRGERWIMDGNYGGTLRERIDVADTVVLLALPRVQCLLRVVGRSMRGRGKARPDMHPECPEQLPDWEFLKWIWLYPRVRLPGILEMLQAYAGRKTVVILRTSAEVEEYLDALRLARVPGDHGATL